MHLIHTCCCDLLPVDRADKLGGLLLILGLDEHKVAAVVQFGVLLLDALGVVGDETVLCLTENLIQHRHGNDAAFDQ